MSEKFLVRVWVDSETMQWLANKTLKQGCTVSEYLEKLIANDRRKIDG